MNEFLIKFTEDYNFIMWLLVFTLIMSMILGGKVTMYLLLLIGLSMVLINQEKLKAVLS